MDIIKRFSRSVRWPPFQNEEFPLAEEIDAEHMMPSKRAMLLFAQIVAKPAYPIVSAQIADIIRDEKFLK